MLTKVSDVQFAKLVYVSAFGTKVLSEALLTSSGLNITCIGTIGVGKTTIIRSIGKALELEFVKITSTGVNPLYLGGIPVLHDGEVILHVPAPYNRLFQNEQQLVYLDEFNHADDAVKALLIQIIQDGGLHGKVVSPRTMFVITCNPPDISSVRSHVPTPILNRSTVVSFKFKPNPKYDPLHPELLFEFPSISDIISLYDPTILRKYINLYKTFLETHSHSIVSDDDEFREIVKNYREAGEDEVIVLSPRSCQRLFTLLALYEMLRNVIPIDEDDIEIVVRGNAHTEAVSVVLSFLRHFNDIKFLQQITSLLNVPDEQISKNMPQILNIISQLNGDQLYFVSFSLLNDAQRAIRWAKALFESGNEPLGMFVVMNMPKGLDLVTRLSRLGLGHIISRVVN